MLQRNVNVKQYKKEIKISYRIKLEKTNQLNTYTISVKWKKPVQYSFYSSDDFNKDKSFQQCNDAFRGIHYHFVVNHC